jgi:hypothetical protein
VSLGAKESLADAELLRDEMHYKGSRDIRSHFQSTAHLSDDYSRRTIDSRFGTTSKPPMISSVSLKEP